MTVNRMATLGGPLVVILYSALMVVTISVLDPMAAVPSMSYANIVAVLGAAGTNVAMEVLAVVAFGAAGVALSAVIAVLGVAGRLGPRALVVWQLAVVAAGGPASFIASFSLGIDVADTFGVGGGAHTMWSVVLYSASALAFFSILSLAAYRFVGDRRGRMLVA